MIRNQPDQYVSMGQAPIEKCRGQYIAWNPSQTMIIAKEPDLPTLKTELTRAGFDPARCLIEYIPKAQ